MGRRRFHPAKPSVEPKSGVQNCRAKSGLPCSPMASTASPCHRSCSCTLSRRAQPLQSRKTQPTPEDTRRTGKCAAGARHTVHARVRSSLRNLRGCSRSRRGGRQPCCSHAARKSGSASRARRWQLGAAHSSSEGSGSCASTCATQSSLSAASSGGPSRRGGGGSGERWGVRALGRTSALPPPHRAAPKSTAHC